LAYLDYDPTDHRSVIKKVQSSKGVNGNILCFPPNWPGFDYRRSQLFLVTVIE